jgi:hypothetical protein
VSKLDVKEMKVSVSFTMIMSTKCPLKQAKSRKASFGTFQFVSKRSHHSFDNRCKAEAAAGRHKLSKTKKKGISFALIMLNFS